MTMPSESWRTRFGGSVRPIRRSSPSTPSLNNQETGTISFDAVVVDFACRDSLALIHRMEEELAAKHPGRRFAIKIDRAYSD